jgi:hypothetical protein
MSLRNFGLAWLAQYVCMCRMITVEHALGCAVRIIRCLLGPSSVDDAKVGFGMSLSVLGCTLDSCMDGFRCTPTPDKARHLENMIACVWYW